MMKNPTQFISDLRKLGFKVEVQHHRNYEYAKPLPCGGSTIVKITEPEGRWSVAGYARCSRFDNYNKRRGIAIALGRAAKNVREQGWLKADPVHHYVLPPSQRRAHV
jgi:hypothetical protein